MTSEDKSTAKSSPLLRFWNAALQFWSGDKKRLAWTLLLSLLVVSVLQLAIQYRINLWNREIFDAIEKKNSGEVFRLSLIFIPIALGGLTLALSSIYARMRMQRSWRQWFTDYVIDRWLQKGRYYQLNLIPGDHENPEGRIAEDVRVATDAPVDFATGILTAIATVVMFAGVLWSVGGGIGFSIGGQNVYIPAYLVISVVVYASITTFVMLMVSRQFVGVSIDKNQKEAEFRYHLTRLRENGESIALLKGDEEERAHLREALDAVIQRWALLARQHMRTGLVANANYLVAPIILIILCAPKFLSGDMTLGQVMQAAAAFVQVQASFNWLVDNYPRIADWTASAKRTQSLLTSLQILESLEKRDDGLITHNENAENGIRLHGLSVMLSDGTVVIDDTDVIIQFGERVLVTGESGSGKSTLVRAISGLWPWGEGEVSITKDARILLLPQKPYIPTGTLRRAVTYPEPVESFDDDTIRDALNQVGLAHIVEKLDDEDAEWHRTLSGGEQQRLAFARLILHRPQIAIMDEATSALDIDSQEHIFKTIFEALPDLAVISVGHRPELEEFHQRKIVLAKRDDGAKLIRDDILPSNPVAIIPVDWRNHLSRWLGKVPSQS